MMIPIGILQQKSAGGALTYVSSSATLNADDFIDWQSLDDAVGDYTYTSYPATPTSDGGDTLTVTKSEGTAFLILQEVSPYFTPGGTNIPNGDYHCYTADTNNNENTITFTDFAGSGAYKFGVGVLPYEAGEYGFDIEAFDGDSVSIGSFLNVRGDTADSAPLYLGIQSSVPIAEIKLSCVDTELGSYAAAYTMTQVDFSTTAPT